MMLCWSLLLEYDGFSWFSFLAGAAAVFLLWFVQSLILLLADIRHTRRHAAVDWDSSDDPADREARDLVETCKKKLRYQKRLNPDWLAPLIEEIPLLITNIATCYHPDADNPLTAPGLSQFARAIQQTASDLTEFLENRRVGRLIDISGSTAWKTWERGKNIATHKTSVTANRWYRKVRPVMQVLAYNSPLMWGGLLASNIGVRVLQPAIIDLIAHRAIELYSGRVPGETAEVQIPTEEELLSQQAEESPAPPPEPEL